MVPNEHGITRIEVLHHNGYVAEILSSEWSGGTMFHYVIQRGGSREILHFGQEVSEQRARELVQEILEDLAERASSQTA